MAPPTNDELNDKRERHCVAVTHERKYYKIGNTWIKRSLRPTEWQKHNGYMHVPLFNPERILNEGACLAFLAKETSIPLPTLHACFEDDGAVYLVTEFVDGIGMNEIDDPTAKRIVEKELQEHVEALKELKSNVWGGPDGLILPPYRVMKHSDGRPWKVKDRDTDDLVFCHNDLSASNVIVDPDTLKIKAIIDWEYSGFFPPEFEFPFYKRAGLSIPLEGESNDVEALLAMLSKDKAA